MDSSRQHQGGPILGKSLGHLSKLASHGMIGGKPCKVFEKKNGLSIHLVKTGQEAHGLAGTIHDIFPRHANQPRGDRPFEKGHSKFQSGGLQKGKNSVLFHRFDDNDRMKRKNQGLDVVDTGRETHRNVKLRLRSRNGGVNLIDRSEHGKRFVKVL